MSTLTMCRTAELDELVIAVRAAIARSAGWRDTASCVAAALRENLPPPDLLPAISATPATPPPCPYTSTAPI